MNRTQYDGLITQSAYERRMQIGKTSTLPIPKLGDQSQVESPLAAASQVVRNQALSSTRSVSRPYSSSLICDYYWVLTNYIYSCKRFTITISVCR